MTDTSNTPKASTKTPLRSFIWRRFSRWLRLRDPRRDLSSILDAADPTDSLQERILWIAQLVHWLRGGSISEKSDDQATKRMVRLRFLLQLLERQPRWRVATGDILRSVLSECEAPSLFAQTTLTEQGGLFAEIFRRTIDKFIPPAPQPGELSYAVEMIFTDNDDLKWLESMSDEDWLRVAEIISVPSTSPALVTASYFSVPFPTAPFPETPQSSPQYSPQSSPQFSLEISPHTLMQDLRDSVVKLSVQAAALGFASDVRVRFRDANAAPANHSPFLDLNRAAIQYREGLAEGARALQIAIDECQAEVEGVYKRIATSGISIALVYRLETMTGLLNRTELLLGFAESSGTETAHWRTARDLLLEIVRTQLDRRSLSSLFGLNFDLFSRKLIEHAGETGEHYITRTRREYWDMFKAAGGGGLLTVITTLAKFAITAIHLPLFFEGLFLSLNYSVSFLAMQGLGFVLATKQPSMTAAALAGRLSETLDRSRLIEFVSVVAQITRSQFIAIIGNVGLVIPGAFAVDWLFQATSGHHIVSAAYAMHTLETFHPFHSGTILFAAETGVILWLSSFGGGWLQNWVIYRRLPEAIATHRTMHAFLGEVRSRELGEAIRHNASGWGSNISIGLLLGFFPVIGRIFGLPFDVRHVTLSAGQMTFAFSALESSMITTKLVVESAIGLTMIGFMNFAVSTACALVVAIRARRVRRAWYITILREVRRGFLRRPLPFFFPPKVPEETSGPQV